MKTVLRSGVALALFAVACGGGEGSRAGRPAADGDSAGPPPAEADRGAASPASASAILRDPVPLKVTAEVGDSKAAYDGLGECHHTADASIYEVPAVMWSAHVAAETGALRDLNLTLWQPKGAAELQVSLGLTVGEQSSDIATVKGAPVKGAATGRVEPKGGGGSLRVEGTDAAGASVRLSIECERWTEPVAEGG